MFYRFWVGLAVGALAVLMVAWAFSSVMGAVR